MKVRNLLPGIILITASSTFAQIPTNGLIAHYPFNGNANDESGNCNNGTVYGASLTSDRFGNLNSAYLFDGNDDYIEINHSSSLNITGQISISFWANFETEAPYYMPYHIIEKGNDWGVGLREYDINAGVTTNDGYFNVWSLNFTPNTIYHFVMTYDGTKVCSYVNSQLYDCATASGTINPNINNVYISRYFDGEGYNFDGVLDDFRIYNRALTTEEITSMYNESKCFAVYDTIKVYDTTHVTIYDTIPVYKEISVTDTLIIDVLLTGVQPPDDSNTLKVYPNPAKDYLIINTGYYSEMTDYSIRIVNQLGETVFETTITQPIYEINLSTWTGKGMYVLQVNDSLNNIKAVKKISLQ